MKKVNDAAIRDLELTELEIDWFEAIPDEPPPSDQDWDDATTERTLIALPAFQPRVRRTMAFRRTRTRRALGVMTFTGLGVSFSL